MRPRTGALLHFSEDPSISEFHPHVAATARQSDPYVWAVDGTQAPAYRFAADAFHPFGGPVPHAFVATRTVKKPARPAEPVDDLLSLHRDAGIQLRVLDDLHEFWAEVVAGTLEFSGIRLANAKSRHKAHNE
jgi:hypothetical protein